MCCFLLASSPLRPPPAPGIVNCLIDKITTASYMHRISLTLPRFPPTALPPLCPFLLRPPSASRGPLWKPAFAYRYRDRALLIDRRLDRLTDHSSLLFLCFAALEHWKVFEPRTRSRREDETLLSSRERCCRDCSILKIYLRLSTIRES